MTGVELAYLIAALSAIAILLFAVRRASERNQLGDSGQSGRRQLPDARETGPAEDDDLGEEPDDESTYTEEGDAAELEDRDEIDRRRDEEAALRAGLAKTRATGFVSRLGKVFARKKLDDEVLAELEEVLFTADIGPKTANALFESIKGELSKSELGEPDAVWGKLREESTRILEVEAEPLQFAAHRPFVLLVLGVNGVGKTTTIGKLAAKLRLDGRKVLLAAGDTFRAAAVEQLEIWGERSGCPVVRGPENGDPSSVIFEAIRRGQSDGFDVVIADTAGRLHTKIDLMEELKKIGRVIDKAMPGAPHETWLVLDATTGQNAIAQAQLFKEAMNISGIVLTKLDGTAKGGVVLGICNEMKVPIRYVGVGEQVADLREFDARAFVAALYAENSQSDAA